MNCGSEVGRYRTFIKKWFEALGLVTEPESAQAIRQQPMWHNMWINVEGRALACRGNIEEMIPLVDNFIDSEGKILSYQKFVELNVGIRINHLTYIGWCKAVPAHWRRKLLGSQRLDSTQGLQDTILVVNGKEMSIAMLRPSFVYALLVPYSIPTAQKRWETDGVNFGNNWDKVYERPFKVTTSTKLQSLQYKITHRFFPTRRF